MSEDISCSFLINNGVAVGVMWFVLFKLNSTLKDLTNAIHSINNRLIAVESNQRNTQLQIHEIKVQVDSLKRGD